MCRMGLSCFWFFRTLRLMANSFSAWDETESGLLTSKRSSCPELYSFERVPSHITCRQQTAFSGLKRCGVSWGEKRLVSFSDLIR